jgi:hypothetical protein
MVMVIIGQKTTSLIYSSFVKADKGMKRTVLLEAIPWKLVEVY